MGSSWSGETGRWQVFKLWRTEKGKCVCQRVNRTQWQGERDTSEAKVFINKEDVFEFFGHGWLAQELFEEAGIDASVDADGEPFFLGFTTDATDHRSYRFGARGE